MYRPSLLALRNRHLFLLDLLILPAAALLAFALRLDASAMASYRPAILLFTAVAVPVQLIVAYWLGIYRRFWRYASVDELVLIAAAAGFSTVLTAALLFGLAVPVSGISCPRSIPLINGLLVGLLMGGGRFAVRIASRREQRRRRSRRRTGEKRVLIMGAGDAGSMIVREMRANPQLGLVPVGYVDDQVRKHGVQIHGLTVLGGRDDIARLVREHAVAEVIIAIPTAPGHTVRQILEICSDAGVPARTIPGIFDILSGQVSISQIREVKIEDLLRREPVEIDASSVQALLHGERVLVTGAGGSIGSELCRQIARAEPASLVLLGHGENSIFQIQGELSQWATCELTPVIADIRDPARLEQAFARSQPEIVFHAAAHKHVPLMEQNICEAINNNILGTKHLLQAAEQAGVSHFVLISSDKAVNPTSVMGATKRVAELLVYCAAQRNKECFSAVRFGNVLGSRGSVVHTFQQQIDHRQPVTVTHPDMRRFFMTIPEAVQLVLQAAALGRGGEVFVLDMGDQVRIVDLATDLIRLSGLRPRVRLDDEQSALVDGAKSTAGVGAKADEKWDVEVVFTGVRPGEKIFEELFAAGEEYAPSQHDKILVVANGYDSCQPRWMERRIGRLAELAALGDEAGVLRLLQEIVPEYQPTGAVAGLVAAPTPATAQQVSQLDS